jgi:hypothetical protein
MILEGGGEFFQVFVREAGADFADALKLFRVLVVACKEVCAVDPGSLSFTVV